MNIYRILGFSFMVAIMVISCSAPDDSEQNNSTMETAKTAKANGLPSFDLVVNLDGGPINLTTYKGKKIFLNMWATWCPPCKAEMPSIERLYASVDTGKVAFIMLSMDENQEDVRSFQRSSKTSLPLYFPASSTPAILQTNVLPATYIFDENGKLIKKNEGADDYDTDAYRQLLQ